MTKHTLLALFLFSACSASMEEDWFPEPPAEGKADGIDLVPGASIPSQYVNQTRSYVRARRIEPLQSVGALDALHEGLARRVDGIIANLPPDGQLHVAELVKMEQPEIFGSLFPAEQAALPDLWKLLLAPANEIDLVLPQFPKSVTEVLPPPVALPTSVQIASVAAALQTSLRRLELQFNSDNDANTVSLADLAAGIGDNQGRYTPADVQNFHATRAHIAKLRANVSPGVARAILPALGPVNAVLAQIGGAKVRIKGASYVLEQSKTCHPSTSQRDTLNTAVLRNDVSLVLEPAANTKLLLLAKAREETSTEIAFAQDSIVEEWTNGVLTGAAIVRVPPTPASVQIDDVFGFRFEDAAANVLPRVGRTEGANCGTGPTGELRSAWTGITLPNTTPTPQLSGAGLRPSLLGHYEMMTTNGPLALQVYEGQVMPIVFFTHNGVRRRGTFRASQYGVPWGFVAGVSRDEYNVGRRPQFVFFPDPTYTHGLLETSVVSAAGPNGEPFALNGLDRID